MKGSNRSRQLAAVSVSSHRRRLGTPILEGGAQRAIVALAAALLFSAFALLLFGASMAKELSHDEHMYVSAGALVARQGLLPYRDYPYFQMPNLVFVYGALFSANSDLLLVARLFSTFCSLGTLALLFYTGYDLHRASGAWQGILVGTAASLLLLLNPIFIYSSGLAWNHDLPVFLVVVACVLYMRAFRAATGGVGRMLAVGAALGLATGTRLSVAVAVVPFIALLPFLPAPTTLKDKRNASAALLTGLVIPLLPSLLLLAAFPQQFLFGNIGYHLLNTTYMEASGYTRAMTLGGKLGYAWSVATEPATLSMLVVLGVVVLLVAVRALRGRATSPFQANIPMILIVAIGLCLLVGSLALSPTWYQYFYLPLPFVILALLYGTKLDISRTTMSISVWLLLALPVLVSAWGGLPTYMRALGVALSPHYWVPAQVHEAGVALAGSIRPGAQRNVLTLAPLIPLEGGLNIYTQFVTGPFAWRSATLLPLARRADFGVIGPDDMGNLLSREPPDAILTGYEEGLEGAFVDYARARGYRAVPLDGGKTLWVSRP